MITIGTPEEWRAYFGSHSSPPPCLTEPQPMLCIPAEGLDPSLSRAEPDDPRCERCGHFEHLHDTTEATPPLVCLYHDSEGPCLCCRSLYLPEPWESEE